MSQFRRTTEWHFTLIIFVFVLGANKKKTVRRMSTNQSELDILLSGWGRSELRNKYWFVIFRWGPTEWIQQWRRSVHQYPEHVPCTQKEPSSTPTTTTLSSRPMESNWVTWAWPKDTQDWVRAANGPPSLTPFCPLTLQSQPWCSCPQHHSHRSMGSTLNTQWLDVH